MESVEQVFLHVRAVEGFRSTEILAATELVKNSDLEEMSGWFSLPSSECVIRFDTLNLFFHPLPSGDMAIGMITPCQRTALSFLHPPKSFYVRVLVVPPSTFRHYGNHPIRLYENFLRRGRIPLLSRPPKRLLPLIPIRQDEHDSNQSLLSVLAENPGPVRMAHLAQSALDSVCTFFSRKQDTLSILSGVLDMMPARFRPELTFSSELFFSMQNPFRLVGVRERQAAFSRTFSHCLGSGVPFFSLDEEDPSRANPAPPYLKPWPQFVLTILKTRRFDFLESCLKSKTSQLDLLPEKNFSVAGDLDELHDLAVAWLHEMEGKPVSGGTISRSSAYRHGETVEMFEVRRHVSEVDRLIPLLNRESRTEMESSPEFSEKMASQLFDKLKSLPIQPRHIPDFSTCRSIHSTELDECLEKLHCFVAEIVSGEQRMLPQLRSLWQRISQRLDWKSRDRIREEYLVLIRSVLMQQPVENQSRPVRRNVRLLELLLVFLEK